MYSQVRKMMDIVQHNVCILLVLFVQIMWRGLQCSARGWEPSPVHWISKATLLIKCYSRPHLLRTNRHCFPTSSPFCKITHSGLLRLMVNPVVCPTAPLRKLETGMIYVSDGHKAVSPHTGGLSTKPPAMYWVSVWASNLKKGYYFIFVFLGQIFPFFEYF